MVCPIHQSELQFDKTTNFWECVPLPDGEIRCQEGCVFKIEKGIPRFVPSDNYTSGFGLQWQKYPKTQLDSYIGQNISQRRLENSLNMPLDALKGKVVLEAGCGAGRFTELLIEKCKFLVSIDLSNAVDANLKNCAGKNPYLLMQADINELPLPHRFFDMVICLGVLQNTPSPEQAIESLGKHVKPGGLLVIDIYTHRSRFGTLTKCLTLGYPLRAILRRLNPELGLKVTIALTAICDPIRKHTCKIKWLDRIAARIFPSACNYNDFPELDSKIIYEWNELDTHDFLTDYYKHYRSSEELSKHLEELGFINISCVDHGITVARATVPN